jgi:hypothetical protein
MHRRDLLASGVVLAGTAAALGTLGAPGGAMAQAPGSQVLTFPVQGLATRSSRGGAVSRFEGTVTLTRFAYNGQLGVTGRISGVVQGAGPRQNISNQTFNALATLTQPGGGAAAQVAACTILELDIGAIRLELLGLVIDIAPIAIDITAIPGGGLLGDLLCALAGLLSGINLGNLGNVLGLLGQLLTVLQRLNAILSPP